MHRLSYQAFKALSDDFDQSVLKTPGIAAYCSSSDWILAAYEALHDAREPFIYRDGEHWVVLSAGPWMHYANVLQPLESLWSFACPLIGPNPKKSALLLKNVLAQWSDAYPLLYLGGIPRESMLDVSINQALAGSYKILPIPGCDCMQGNLENGALGFLSRRSGKFRAELRRSERKAMKAGITFEVIASAVNGNVLFQRVLTVEQRSWKWKKGESIFQSDAAAFYTRLFHYALLAGRLRVVFAQSKGGDVAYAFGAQLGSSFRGLQMGYDTLYRQYGLGNLCQWELIKCNTKLGCILYDLGMIIDYKSRWSDQVLALVNLLMVRNS